MGAFDSKGILSCTLSQLSDTVGVSDRLPEHVEPVAPLLSLAQKKRNNTDDVEDSILKAVTRMEAAMEKDRQYARTICIRERMDTLQDLQRKYRCKVMEARIKGYKKEEEELAQEWMEIELEYKKRRQIFQNL